MNSASWSSQPLSPGELISLFRTDSGAPPATVALGVTDPLPTELASLRLLINGTAAPLLYVDSRQINALVPTTISGADSVMVEVEFKGQKSNQIKMPFRAASPGIFVLSDPEYHVTSEVNRGATVLIFGAGAGVMSPWPGDGHVATSAGKIAAPLEVLLGSILLPVDYAGPAPSLLAGVFQLNVRVPDTVPPDIYQLQVRIGGTSAYTFLTVH